uniref:Secreted protein n=1 Tax=Haemonchus placei TaxID=6290 RepID=A0A0N4W941_HAEPC
LRMFSFTRGSALAGILSMTFSVSLGELPRGANTLLPYFFTGFKFRLRSSSCNVDSDTLNTWKHLVLFFSHPRNGDANEFRKNRTETIRNIDSLQNLLTTSIFSELSTSHDHVPVCSDYSTLFSLHFGKRDICHFTGTDSFLSSTSIQN